jgi:CheY-like chemotaxis protein
VRGPAQVPVARHPHRKTLRTVPVGGGEELVEGGLQVVFGEDPTSEFVLVVTDVSMPGSMDGLELAAEIGRLRPGLPVIVVSGSVASLGRARVGEVVRAVLQKPFRPAELVEIARELAPGAFARPETMHTSSIGRDPENYEPA